VEKRTTELKAVQPVSLPTPEVGHGPVVRSHGRTDTGRVRTSNQDHFLIAELARTLWVLQTSLTQPEVQFGHRRGHLFLIADGMGGHKGGEVASAMTVTTVEQFMLDVFRKAEDFQTALKQAHARILDEAARHPEVSGMGTTLTMAIAQSWKLFVVHAGDSRCYLHRGEEFKQLTTDHTVVGELVRRGVLKPADAAHHMYRHVVTNVVGGTQESVQVEVQEVDLQPEDVLLLCTDGLTDMLPNDRMAAILQSERDPRTACDRLVEEALEQGGKDNITAIVTHLGASSGER
jgi:serine/threonine protein phosphatase PrpC